MSISQSDPSIRKLGVTYSDNIYIPSHLKITPTLFSILKSVAERQRNVVAMHSFEKHPYYYITVDYLPEVLKNSSTLREEEKSKKAVDEALKQMLDIYTGGKIKYGYLYPIFIQEDKKILTKIVIISPQIEHETPIAPFRKNCFEFSKKVLDSILNNKVKRSRDIEDKHPFQALIKTRDTGEVIFTSDGLSIERDLNHLIKKAFLPYSTIPMDDFLNDFIAYGNATGRLIEILPNYHIIEDEVEINEKGDFQREPNLYFHFFTLLKALEEVALKYMLEIAHNVGYYLASNHIQSHKDNFSPIYSDSPKKEISRLDSLKDILDHFPEDNTISKSEQKLISSAREAFQILRALEKALPFVQEKKDRLQLESYVESVCLKVINHCREKKTLYVLDVGTVLKTSGVTGRERLYSLEKILRMNIMDRFPYVESRTADNKVFYYLGYYPNLSAVAYNLERLSFTNDSYVKQFEISRSMLEKATIQAHPDLDTELSEEEKKSIEKGKENLIKLQEKRKKKKEFEDTYNLRTAVLGFIFSIIYFLVLYLFFKHTALLYAALPVSIGTSYLISRIFSKRGFREKIGSENKKIDGITVTPEELTKVEEILFAPQFNSIEDRIFDRNSFRETIIKNLDKLKIISKDWAQETNSDSLALKIETSLMASMAVVQVPKDQAVKNKPVSVLFFKEDLKSSEMRGKLADYYHFRRSAAKSLSSSTNNLFGYYNYLYNVVERDYYKFVKH